MLSGYESNLLKLIVECLDKHTTELKNLNTNLDKINTTLTTYSQKLDNINDNLINLNQKIDNVTHNNCINANFKECADLAVSYLDSKDGLLKGGGLYPAIYNTNL